VYPAQQAFVLAALNVAFDGSAVVFYILFLFYEYLSVSFS